jgi:hypothetical protein
MSGSAAYSARQVGRIWRRRPGRSFAASTGTSPDGDLLASHAAPSRTVGIGGYADEPYHCE